ncbi:MAG: NAD-dependent deacylase [Thermodesulfobacteriota bacterium]
MSIRDEILRAASILAEAENAVASTGAGISAESGIATFRDPGGVWERLNPAEVGTTYGLVSALNRHPEKYVSIFIELLESLEQAEPNSGHRALSDLESLGIVKTIITQNIDNLHQEAGNTRVIEVHGNGFRLCCTSCGIREEKDRKALLRETRDRIRSLTSYSLEAFMEVMPRCESCGAMMRPDVVMFGEAVQGLPAAFDAVRTCQVMLALGTSGVVYPAAYFPFEAKQAGAYVIVVNPRENPFYAVSDVYLPMKAGEALPEIVAAVRKIRGADQVF